MPYMTKFDITKLPEGIQKLVGQLFKKHPRGVELGPMRKDTFTALQKRNDAYTDPDLVAQSNDVRHLQKSRMEKPRPSQKMVPEEIGGVVNSLQHSSRARVVTGKDEHPDAVVVPHGERTFFGVFRPEDDGSIGLQTAFYPKTKALPNRLGSAKNNQSTYKDWVDANLPFNYAPRSTGGREFTQRELSAVEPSQVAVDETIDTSGKGVKGIVPPLILATVLGGDDARAAALADPSSREKAQAAGLPYDPPIQEAMWSPVDALLAPIGAVGIPAKMLAMAFDLPMTLGFNAAYEKLFGK